MRLGLVLDARTEESACVHVKWLEGLAQSSFDLGFVPGSRPARMD